MTYLIVFLLSLFPFIELRGSIPYGIINGLNPIYVFLISVAGNILPVPFLILFLEDIEKLLRRWKRISRALDWLFERTYKKADKKVRKWEYLALIFFVAIPLPGTGAWTGSLIAYLFKMGVKRATFMIFIGVVIAGIIVTILSLYGINIFLAKI